jgi:hypothetical protein
LTDDGAGGIVAGMQAMLTILSPVPDDPGGAATAPAHARDLPGLIRVGLLSNGKPNTPHLLDGIAAVLGADSRFVLTVRTRKESAARPADQAILDRLAAGSDLVVGATAD